MKTPIRFIVFDDDEINNFYCSIIIADAADEIEIRTSDVPEKGFEYITEEYSYSERPTVLSLASICQHG
jgi:hypothetical protein